MFSTDHKKISLIFLTIILLNIGCVSEPIQIGTELPGLSTPNISDLENNLGYHEQKIELTGYYFFTYEMNGLFKSKLGNPDEAIWVNFSDELTKQINQELFNKLQGRKLRVQGTFNAKRHGHLMQYLGNIELDFLETLD